MTRGGNVPGGFRSRPFSEINLDDSFFDSLKTDYPEFSDWYQGKTLTGAIALVVESEIGAVEAFVYLKEETDDQIELTDGVIEALPRLKIGTLKIAAEAQGERLGEGAIGLALWRWRDSGLDEVYVTVFEKHDQLVGLLEKFGFKKAGQKTNGESVYIKSRNDLDYSTAYTAFPFIDPRFDQADILTIEQDYHDRLFPYSELAGTEQEVVGVAAGNGVTKVYVGHGWKMAAAAGNPVLIYRKFTGPSPGFKSVVTSYGVITDVRQFKNGGNVLRPYEEYRELIKNKSVFNDEDLNAHWAEANVIVVELVYLGYFGPGKNINWVWLKQNGFTRDSHPNQWTYSRDEFFAILSKGGVSVEDALVD